jgi:heat shock protein HtpX
MTMRADMPLNLYDQQAKNRRMTIFVMFGFGLFVAFLGFGVDAFLLGSISEDSFFPIGTIAGMLFGSISAFWSLNGGTKAVIASTGAQPVDSANPAHQQLINVVDEMRIASGMPMPQVYLIPDDDPNAFAAGSTPEKSVIAVTEGLLKTLNREELQGVVAHEMSHIRNYDIRVMTVIAALVGTVLVLSDVATRSMRFGGGQSRSKSKSSGAGGILFVVWIIAIILAPLIGQLLAMMVSRKREYLADASAAELTRNPLGLASALEKLDAAVTPTATIRKGSAHLCIVDPLGRTMNAKEGVTADLFGTHPPIEKRVEALKNMAYQKTR